MKNLRPLTCTLISLAIAVVPSLASFDAVFATASPANAPAGSTFDQRLVQRKQEQNEQIDVPTQQHIQQVCVQETNSIRALQANAPSMTNNRTATYLHIDGIVLVSMGQLKLASMDTFTLEQDRNTMVQKISTFQTTAANYQQTLGDLLVINCKADPAGFQALLDTARAYYTQLGTESHDISSYIANTLQPVLQGFITQLQHNSNAQGQGQ